MDFETVNLPYQRSVWMTDHRPAIAWSVACRTFVPTMPVVMGQEQLQPKLLGIPQCQMLDEPLCQLIYIQLHATWIYMQGFIGLYHQ